LVDVHLLGGTPPTLRVRIAVTLAVVAFSGLLRCDDIRGLSTEPGCMLFHHDRAELFLSRSKTDQRNDGAWIILARLEDSPYCPVGLLESLLAAAPFAQYPGALARGVTGKDTLRPGAKPLAASSLRSMLLEVCTAAGLDPEGVGYHSLRIGGTSEIAASGLVPDRLTREHGRWRSVIVFEDCYARPDLASRLLPSRHTGLA